MFIIMDGRGRYWACSPVSDREADLWRLVGRPPKVGQILEAPQGASRMLKRLGYTRVNRVPEPLRPDHLWALEALG